MKSLLQRILTFIGLLIICVSSLVCYSYPQLRNTTIFEADSSPLPTPTTDLSVSTAVVQCPGAPFIIPTDGWIGIVYGDSIFGTTNHSGLDIFGLEGNGVTPIYAAYDGYATRLPEWRSAIIIRHPEDPLNPGSQIWTYYTHLAAVDGTSYIIDEIPAGTYELPIKKGTLLGYQGDYNGLSARSIDTHLHFSIVKDDGNGQFLNETDLTNTLDPSPYLGMRLHTQCADRPPICRPDFSCP